ncbi:MAG: hypothetical protein SFY92_00745 [Verrucomicrobiae bacterium]|nr:hypothetical protein [Verrucomicrobiae bacterium]
MKKPLYYLEHYRQMKDDLLTLGADVLKATNEFSAQEGFDVRQAGSFRMTTRRNILKIHEDVLAVADTFPHSADKLRQGFIQELNAQLTPQNTRPENIPLQTIKPITRITP